MTRTAAPALSALLLAACSAPRIDAMGRYGQYQLEGDIALNSGSAGGSNDVEDLGLDEEEGTAGVLVDFKWGVPHLTVSTQKTSFSGDGTLDTSISFDGNTIDAGADVSSDLDLGLTSATLTFDLVPGPAEVGIGLGVSLIDVDASFEEQGTGESVETDELLPAPVLAVRGGIELGAFEFAGLLSGLAADLGSDGSVDYFDLDLFGRWIFLGGEEQVGGALVVGWRQMDLDLEYDDEEDDVAVDIGFSGPYVGVQVRF